MNIPNFLDVQVIDSNGHFTGPWKEILSQLLGELQGRMSEESHIVPSQPTSKIALLNSTDYNGGLLYDSDAHKLKVNINGTFKEVQTT